MGEVSREEQLDIVCRLIEESAERAGHYPPSKKLAKQCATFVRALSARERVFRNTVEGMARAAHDLAQSGVSFEDCQYPSCAHAKELLGMELPKAASEPEGAAGHYVWQIEEMDVEAKEVREGEGQEANWRKVPNFKNIEWLNDHLNPPTMRYVDTGAELTYAQMGDVHDYLTRHGIRLDQ